MLQVIVRKHEDVTNHEGRKEGVQSRGSHFPGRSNGCKSHQDGAYRADTLSCIYQFQRRSYFRVAGERGFGVVDAGRLDRAEMAIFLLQGQHDKRGKRI
ncbi:hypothetical protein MNBD_GAMMA15-549 [hydrothermal vent metagenome]|uniref:Uncharacterized protein n=1 Tax=hydrothermal vent metagenome TaxID=652676 RepID=A0A3B0ZK44_9ZZZZ